MEREIKEASLPELFWEFFKLGMFTIGGGITMIPLLQGIVADKKKWMDEEEVTDIIAMSQSLPGVVAINMATFVGSRKRGLAGAFVATFGVMLPSLISIIMILEFLKNLGDNRYIDGAFKGIRAAATGLIIYSAYRICAKVLTGPFAWAVCIASFAAISFLDVSIVYIVLASIVIGIIYQMTQVRKEGGRV